MTTPFLQLATVASPDRPLALVAGGELRQARLAYETWGTLSPRRDNLILITTGLSATSHVARHAPDDAPGWWEEMVGPGHPIDTERYFVVCSNVLGGCFGSTGPASENPDTGRVWGPEFPVLHVEDMVRAQARLLDHLGVERPFCVLGSSLGGMLALQWGALEPERVRSLCAIAAPGRSYAFSIAWRAVQRAVVTSDPAWQDGRYPPGGGPVAGLNNARAIGILSYRSPAEFDERFGRDYEGDARTGRFAVESYLDHNASKFGERYDANSYLTVARAMDFFDLGRGCASYEDGVARIQAPSLVVGFSTDMLFPVAQQREVAEILRRRGRPVRYEEFDTVHGHDTFLIEIDRLGRVLTEFFGRVDAGLRV